MGQNLVQERSPTDHVLSGRAWVVFDLLRVVDRRQIGLGRGTNVDIVLNGHVVKNKHMVSTRMHREVNTLIQMYTYSRTHTRTHTHTHTHTHRTGSDTQQMQSVLVRSCLVEETNIIY